MIDFKIEDPLEKITVDEAIEALRKLQRTSSGLSHYKISELYLIADVEERKKGEWDMFDLISSAYYGKGMYFKQDNGTVYSRHSGGYMTVDEAIREFISLIDGEDIAFVPSVTTELTDIRVGKWIPVTERLPEEYTRVIGFMAWKAMTAIEYQNGKWYSIDHLEPLPDEAVTHWMPLPQPPKEEA